MKFLPLFLIIIVVGLIFFNFKNNSQLTSPSQTNMQEPDDFGGEENKSNSLSIESLRLGNYPGSDITIEQELESGASYKRYLTSYLSEGLKIYALLTVPNGNQPEGGWPVIIFNHGYIPPAEYRTTERYIAYTDGFSRNGYVLFRPDYRGHGSSEGQASGGYGSNGYTIDVLNAVASIKKLPYINKEKIGMWGHSMGGFITLRNMVVNKDVKAGVIWAGVVASYEDLFSRWRRSSASPGTPSTRGGSWRQTLQQQFGDPSQNPTFWNSLSSNSFLADISGPLQLHHGTADTSVPVEFSQKLESQMKNAGKDVELFVYPGDDHNLANNFSTALQRSIEFFNQHLK